MNNYLSSLRQNFNQKVLNQRPVYIKFIIAFVAFLSYARTLEFDFVWDDWAQLVRNESIYEWNNVITFFLKDIWQLSAQKMTSGYYRPVGLISYLIDKTVYGMHAWGYHLTNVIIHSVNAALVFDLANLLTGNFWISLLSGMLFAVHPIHIEAVAFIASRFDLVALFFALNSSILYLKSIQITCQDSIRLKLSYLCYLIALFSKESTAFLPGIIILIELHNSQENQTLFKWKRIAPFILITIFYLIARNIVLGGLSTGFPYFGGSLWKTILTMTHGTLIYLRNLFLPYRLSVFYDIHISSSIMEVNTLVSAACVTLLLIFSYIISLSRSKLWFPFAWFWLAFVPVSNILPTAFLVADRFIYTPSVGFSIGFAIIFYKIKTFFSKSTYFYQNNIINWISVGICLIFMIITIQHSGVWKNDMTLWNYTINTSPKYKVSYLNLARKYLGEAKYDLALRLYDQAKNTSFLRDQDEVEIYNQTAIILMNIYGKTNDAIDVLKEGIQNVPNSEELLFNLALAYERLAYHSLAIETYHRVLSLNPSYANAWLNLAILYERLDKDEDARKCYQTTISLDPNNSLAMYDYANFLNRKGKLTEAENWYEKSVGINPNFVEAIFNLAHLEEQIGNLSLSYNLYQRVLKLNPELKIAFERLRVIKLNQERMSKVIPTP